jgi:ATP phosphoribosyltransferase
MNTSDSQIRLALPSKGRMAEETLEFLDECGLRINKVNPRQYSATIPALPQVMVLFQRARDIPSSVAAGDIDLAITGYDVVADALGSDPRDIVIIHDALGYGECELVLAVPDTWDDVQNVEGLAARARGSKGLRVATKHGKVVERFFKERSVTNIQIVTADGTLEAAPTVGYADLIADISSTGTTLRENHLQILPDGVILKSAAVLIGNQAGLEAREDVLAVTKYLLEFIEAHLRAQGQYMVFANMRGSTAQEIAARVLSQPGLSGLQGPTISPVVSHTDEESGWWAINIIVPSRQLYTAVEQIRSIDGSGVIVTPVRYIFEERPVRYQRLLEGLKVKSKT